MCVLSLKKLFGRGPAATRVLRQPVRARTLSHELQHICCTRSSLCSLAPIPPLPPNHFSYRTSNSPSRVAAAPRAPSPCATPNAPPPPPLPTATAQTTSSGTPPPPFPPPSPFPTPPPRPQVNFRPGNQRDFVLHTRGRGCGDADALRSTPHPLAG